MPSGSKPQTFTTVPKFSKEGKETLRQQLSNPQLAEYVISWAASSNNNTLRNAIEKILEIKQQRRELRRTINRLLEEIENIRLVIKYFDGLEDQLLDTATRTGVMTPFLGEKKPGDPEPVTGEQVQELIEALTRQIAITTASDQTVESERPTVKKPKPHRYDPTATSSQTGRRTPPTPDPSSRSTLHQSTSKTIPRPVHGQSKRTAIPPKRTRSKEDLQRRLNKRPNATCFICTQTGHWSWECVDHWCSECQAIAPGHPIGGCTKERKGKGKGREERPEESTWSIIDGYYDWQYNQDADDNLDT